MNRNRHRRRRSEASIITSDIAYVSNRLPWWGAAMLGVFLWLFFAHVIPSMALAYLQGSLSNSSYKPMLIEAFGRRVHWLEYLGIGLGLICAFFAVRNYFSSNLLNQADEKRVGVIGRLLGKFLD